MEASELELGKSYSGEVLLDFLEENCRRNVLLVSEENMNMRSRDQRNKKFVVYDIQEIFLHRFDAKEEAYKIEQDPFKLYYDSTARTRTLTT